MGWFENAILEKPKSKEEAFTRLKSLSGNNFQFFTGVHVINTSTEKVISKVVTTDVKMRKLTDSEINKYLEQDSNFTTYALGFDPLGHFSSSFAEIIDGSYNNLLRGIPLEAIIEMLKEVGLEI